MGLNLRDTGDASSDTGADPMQTVEELLKTVDERLGKRAGKKP